MSFRSRLLRLCVVLAGLIVLLFVGIIFSPDRVQERTSGQPLLPGVVMAKIDSIELRQKGETRVLLRRTAGGWVTPEETSDYPASSERITTFLRTVTGLRRTSLVSSDPSHLAELGLSADSSRVLVLHQAGAADVVLLVGKRATSGDGDYVQVRGQAGAFLARGALSFFLNQDHPSWYELHVLPDDVQGSTIASIFVKGGPGVDYALTRPSADKPDAWLLNGHPADRVTAGAMASSLANLEGVDFAAAGAVSTGAGKLDITVTTFAGKKYSLVVVAGPDPDRIRITTDWSPWTYLVNPVPFRRAVLPESSLAAH